MRWQKDVLADLDALEQPIEDRRFVAECLSGRLTGLDRLAERIPEAKDILVRRAGERGLLPEPVVNALTTFPRRPAGWLTDSELSAPELEDLRLMSKAVREAVTDGHRDAVLKCLQIWAAVQAGTFRSDKMTIGSWYHATKFALEALSDCVRLEAAPFGVDVAVIEPGGIRTEWGGIAAQMLKETSGNGAYASQAEAVAGRLSGEGNARFSSDPSVIAKAISKAASAKRPKTRYAVGFGAKPLIGLHSVLPDRTFDVLIKRASGIKQ